MADEDIARNVVQEVEEESLEMRTLIQLLLFFADLLYPQSSQNAKNSSAVTPLELKVATTLGKNVDEDVDFKQLEADEIRKLIRILTELPHPQLVQCEKSCIARDSCKSKADEAIDRIANEEGEVKANELHETEQFSPLFAEELNPQIDQCVKTCQAENPCELKMEEVIARNVDGEVEVQSEMEELLHFLAEMLHDQLAQWEMTDLAKISYPQEAEKFFARSLLKEVEMKTSETNEVNQLLPSFGECVRSKAKVMSSSRSGALSFMPPTIHLSSTLCWLLPLLPFFLFYFVFFSFFFQFLVFGILAFFFIRVSINVPHSC
ncbi:hypothetical protein TcWFU_008988 [Taenia crassiceps]|uniref:Uncharacterized protein n=1 Tax=Taenia crassiceps TaxID=6207 RepID=A0ABR4Q5Q2_9CEST